MKLTLLVVFLCATFALGLCYSCKSCYGNMCCNIPSDGNYFLTSFCAGYPHSQTSCGSYCDQYRYFTADRQRYGCNGYLNICANGKCVKAKVIDAGPAAWVEEKAGGPIIDASTAVCQALFGVSSCGWSDYRRVHVSVADDVTDDSQLGPWEPTPEEYQRIISSSSSSSVDPAPTPCCTADQWEGYRFSWDERRHFRAGFNISYDYTNKRIRTLITEMVRGNRERVFEAIALFAQKRIFVINHRTNSCHVSTLNEEMQRDCIPPHAVHEGSIIVGGALAADIWAWEAHVNGTHNRVFDIRTTATCTQIDTVFVGRRIGIDVSFWWDITKGIKNPTVFNPPPICHSESNHLVTFAKELTAIINRKQWSQLSEAVAKIF